MTRTLALETRYQMVPLPFYNQMTDHDKPRRSRRGSGAITLRDVAALVDKLRNEAKVI